MAWPGSLVFDTKEQGCQLPSPHHMPRAPLDWGQQSGFWTDLSYPLGCISWYVVIFYLRTLLTLFSINDRLGCCSLPVFPCFQRVFSWRASRKGKVYLMLQPYYHPLGVRMMGLALTGHLWCGCFQSAGLWLWHKQTDSLIFLLGMVFCVNKTVHSFNPLLCCSCWGLHTFPFILHS